MAVKKENIPLWTNKISEGESPTTPSPKPDLTQNWRTQPKKPINGTSGTPKQIGYPNIRPEAPAAPPRNKLRGIHTCQIGAHIRNISGEKLTEITEEIAQSKNTNFLRQALKFQYQSFHPWHPPKTIVFSLCMTTFCILGFSYCDFLLSIIAIVIHLPFTYIISQV